MPTPWFFVLIDVHEKGDGFSRIGTCRRRVSPFHLPLPPMIPMLLLYFIIPLSYANDLFQRKNSINTCHRSSNIDKAATPTPTSESFIDESSTTELKITIPTSSSSVEENSSNLAAPTLPSHVGESFNYASFDCGALIRSSNKEAKHSTAILLSSKDAYLLNPCSAEKYVEIELCQDILVREITMANFEFFSSQFRDISIYGSSKFPPDWTLLGNFTSKNVRDRQNFAIKDPVIWVKFVRIEILSHYGQEFYCPLTSLQIFGTTMLEEMKQREEKLINDTPQTTSSDAIVASTRISETATKEHAMSETSCPYSLTSIFFTTKLSTSSTTSDFSTITNSSNDNLDEEVKVASSTPTFSKQDSIFIKIVQRISQLERLTGVLETSFSSLNIFVNETSNSQLARIVQREEYLERMIGDQMLVFEKNIQDHLKDLEEKKRKMDEQLMKINNTFDDLKGQGANNSRRATFERRELENRRRQDQRQDIIKELQQDSLLMNTIASDERVDRKRRVRQTGIQEIEKATLNSYIEEHAKTQRIKDELEREEKHIREKQLIHQQMLKEQKLRQSIKEGSSELRELEQKLKYAYMNKERSLQLQEKALLAEKAIAEDISLYGNWKVQAEQVEIDEIEAQKKNHAKVVEYQKSLHKQVEEIQKKKKEDYEQFLKEKSLVDEIVKKIFMEKQKDSQQRLEKQQETKAFVEKFMMDRQEWLEKEKKRQEEENAKIAEFARMQAEREESVIIKKKMMAADKDAIYDKLASEIENKEKLKSELEDLRIDLAQEEQEAQARKREADLLQLRIRKRLETVEAYQAQIADKRKRSADAKVEEDIFRAKLMEKFAEDDRIEQMKQTTRRLKQLEHKRAVDELVRERNRLIMEKEQKEKEQDNLEAEFERYKLAVIEQERQRLLQQHASKLAGFLPKGVLRDKRDLELFDEQFRAKFG